jgi:hypothetical protein
VLEDREHVLEGRPKIDPEESHGPVDDTVDYFLVLSVGDALELSEEVGIERREATAGLNIDKGGTPSGTSAEYNESHLYLAS